VASTIRTKINTDLVTAMKAKDAATVQALRNMTSAFKKKEIDDNKDLEDADVEKIMRTLEKQLIEALEQAKTANRPDSLAEVEAEIKVLKKYLPAAMSSQELDAAVTKVYEKLKSEGKLAQGGAAMGMMMKEVMALTGGKADGRLVQEAVKKKLA
jgi:uncharacterized protein